MYFTGTIYCSTCYTITNYNLSRCRCMATLHTPQFQLPSQCSATGHTIDPLQTICMGSSSTCKGGKSGHRFLPLAHCMLGQLPRQHQSTGSLNVPGCQCGPLVDACESGRLAHYTIICIHHEGLHGLHCLARDPQVWVDLLQHLEQADEIRTLEPL